MPETATRPLVTGVDFIGIPTKDLAKAIEFYRDVLGLPMTVDRSPHNAEFETGTVTFSVLDPVKMNIGEFLPNRNPIALHVDDVAEARTRLEAAGVTFTMANVDTGVCHMAFFDDPDGNEYMLHNRYAPRENGTQS